MFTWHDIKESSSTGIYEFSETEKIVLIRKSHHLYKFDEKDVSELQCIFFSHSIYKPNYHATMLTTLLARTGPFIQMSALFQLMFATYLTPVTAGTCGAVKDTFQGLTGGADCCGKIRSTPTSAACSSSPFITYHSTYLPGQDITMRWRASGSPGDPLIMAMPGWPTTGAIYEDVLKQLGSSGYYAVAVDMRGYGGTSKPSQGSGYDMNDIADDVIELLGKIGYDKAIWVADDFGTFPQSIIAVHHPELVRAVINLNNPQSLQKGVDGNSKPEDQGLDTSAYGVFGYFYRFFFQTSGPAPDVEFAGNAELILRMIGRSWDSSGPQYPPGTQNLLALVTPATSWTEAIQQLGYNNTHPPKIEDTIFAGKEDVLAELAYYFSNYPKPGTFYYNAGIPNNFDRVAPPGFNFTAGPLTTSDITPITKPYMFLSFQNDYVLQTAHPEYGEDWLQGPRAVTTDFTLETMAGGHFSMVDRHQELATKIVTFLDTKALESYTYSPG